MRITTFLLLLGLMQTYATNSYSQNTKLSLKMEDASIEAILSKIEKVSEFHFFYRSNEIDSNMKQTIDINEQTIDEVLNSLLKNSNLTYKIFDKYIAIISKENANENIEGLFQQKTITGRVTDQTGAPIPGASIVVKGTTTGITTDKGGNYKLLLPPDARILVFSFVGMRSQEIPINDRTILNVVMQEETIGLQEVVAVGYGTQRKKDLTGAVSSLKMADKEDLPITNVVEALRGSIAGVNVNLSGVPGSNGSLTIRGLTSLSAGNGPLIIVDGIPLAGSLNDINPNDIQSVDVLKDGSAAAVYGAKSANGVLLITTKRGSSSKPVIQFNTYTGVQDYSHRIKLLNGPAFAQKTIDYYKSNGVENPVLQDYMQDLEYKNYLDGRTIDPFDIITQKALIQTQDVSVSGKNDRTTYYMSGAYTHDKGIVYNANFKRFSFRTNLENKVTDWLTIGFNASFSNRDDSGLPGDLQKAVVLGPYSQMKDDQGNNLMLVYGGGEALAQNPIFDAARTLDLSNNQNLTGNLYAKIDIPFIKGLSYRLNYSNTFNWKKHFQFTPPYYLEGQHNTGSGFREHSDSYDWILENIVNYKKHFGIHDIDVTLLYSRDHGEYSFSSLSNSNFFTEALGYDKLELGTNPVIATNAVESNGLSTMGRINYRMKDRYLLTLLARRDGYSAFGKGKKFGVFPSMALGWLISEENFMKNIKAINSLKLRYSYGETGNQAISSYSSLTKMSQNNYVFGDGSSTYIGLINSAMGNKDLTWETTLAENVGLDFTILNNRISGSVEYYSTKTKNLLMQRSIPVMTGYSSVFTNLGGISNKGLELTLSSKNLKGKEFEWNTTVTFSTNKNRITSLYGTVDANGKPLDDISNGWFIGQPIGAIYDYTLNGVYQVGENIPSPFQPGYFRIVDKNGNGAIDPDDRSIIGKTNPDFRLGLENTWKYKDFSLMVFVNSSFGGMKSNPMLNPANYFPDRLNIMVVPGEVPYWTAENRSNTRPTIGYAMPYTHGFYESLTYVRIQDVSLSYELPKKLVAKAKIGSLRVYISGKNLATFTKWSGWDPEIAGIGTGSAIEMGGYPMMKSYVAGINLSF